MVTLSFQKRKLLVADKFLESSIGLAKKAAKSELPLFICGESGTGKELVARFVHENSTRNQMPFISVNCAALPDGLVEAELFGYEKGAFTGASCQKIGKFEQASFGTLLLDEVSEMPFSLQAKLLRVLQEGEIDRLGGRGPIKIRTRVIATTNQLPQELIARGLFREDLFYRLNVLRIDLPPLRGRAHAIKSLALEFLERIAETQECHLSFSDLAVEKLVGHDWPGNIRELQNVLERAALSCDGKLIGPEELELSTRVRSPEGVSHEALADLERGHILKILEENRGNREKAAKKLGISSRTLRSKLKLYAEG